LPRSPRTIVSALIALGVARTQSYGRIARHYRQRGTDQAVMSMLADRGELTNGELARGLGMTTGGVTPIIDRLADRDLVVRIPNPDDRRSSTLRLTDEGRRMMGAGRAILEEELAPVARALNAEQHEAVVEVLERATQAYDTAASRLTSPEGEVPEWKLEED
jgi:DNA-binding MarR family transcriptional regulator